MHDMNFFEPFQSKGKKFKKNSLLKVVIAAILISLILIPAGLYITLIQYKSELDEKKSVLQIPENMKLLNEVKIKQDKVDSFQVAFTQLKLKYAWIQSEKWFDEELMQVIVDTLPKQIQLTDLVFATTRPVDSSAPGIHSFKIFGVSADKPAIAELEYNLRQTDRFVALFVSIIEMDGGLMRFDLEFTVKDGTRP